MTGLSKAFSYWTPGGFSGNRSGFPPELLYQYMELHIHLERRDPYFIVIPLRLPFPYFDV